MKPKHPKLKPLGKKAELIVDEHDDTVIALGQQDLEETVIMVPTGLQRFIHKWGPEYRSKYFTNDIRYEGR